jgi:phage gp46-like protein
MITIRPLDRAGAGDLAPPDMVWTGFAGDVDPESNRQAIRSAVLMLLFTDARCDPEELRAEHAGDRRGWVGDGFAGAGEGSLGSKLWLLRRSVLTPAVARQAEAEAVRALQPLVAQGVAATVTAVGAITGDGNCLDLAITVSGRDGRPVFADQFDLLWRQ